MGERLPWPSERLEEIAVNRLYDSFLEDCVMLEHNKFTDGEGGHTTDGWSEGEHVRAAVVISGAASHSRVAEEETLSRRYDVTTPDITLNFGDVFKRVGSDEVYRVTSQGNDKTTPRVAGFRFSQVTAERWELTT